jgi:hypothetical protein
MSREKKGKQPQIHIHLNQSKSRPSYIESGPSETIEDESFVSSSPTVRPPTIHQNPQSRHSNSIPIHQSTSTYVGSSSRAPSPLRQPLARRSFVGRTPLPNNTSYRPTEASIREEAHLDHGEYPVDNNNHPVVPDFLPPRRTEFPDTTSEMNSHNNYYNQGTAPGASTWSSRTHSQPHFAQRLRPADDPEIMRLKAELEAYRVIEEKSKAAEERRKKEEEIRKDAEAEFQLRWEALQKAQEDTKLEMERIKKEAEAAAWERVEKEKREQEAMKIREEHQARIMESEIRTKIEVERKAEEQEKRSREKLESEIETRLKKKMMDKVDDFMRVVEHRFLTYPTVSAHHRGALGTESQKGGSYGEPESQLTSQYELPPNWTPSIKGYPAGNEAYCTPTPSQSPRTTGYPPSNADPRHGGRPPSVPDAPDQFPYAEELSPQESRFYRHNQPHFYPRPISPSRGRTRNRSHGYNTGQPYREEEIRTRIPTHPDLVQQLAYAVNDVLRDQIFNDMMMRRDMDDRQHYYYPSSFRQVSVDPRVYPYAADRAAAIEAQRQRKGETEYQNDLPRQFGPPQGMMNGQGQVFERPCPSPGIIPRNRLSSTGGTTNADRASESSKTQVSAYQTPPQSHGGTVLLNGNRPSASTTASMLNIPRGENGEFDRRGHPALEDERSKTYVNPSLEALPRDSKLENQLSAATAYMNLKGT